MIEDFSRRNFINGAAKILTGTALFGFFPDSAEAKKRRKNNDESTKVVERGYRPGQKSEEELASKKTDDDILNEEPFEEPKIPIINNPLGDIPVIKNDLHFVQKMDRRHYTGAIVIHHAGTARDMDLDVQTIHRWHINNGWAGIGYHYLIHKDGTVESARPPELVGAHCYRNNKYTIGICVVGNFNLADPTYEQFFKTEQVVAALCKSYGFKPNAKTVLGHRDLGRTDCPGKRLYYRLPEIIRNANFYL